LENEKCLKPPDEDMMDVMRSNSQYHDMGVSENGIPHFIAIETGKMIIYHGFWEYPISGTPTF